MLDNAENGVGTPSEKLQVVIEQLNEKIKNNPDKKINDLFDAYAPGVYRNDNK